MTTSAASDEKGSDARRPTPPRRTARRVAAVIGLALGVVVMFFGVTTITGFPGPGPLRRYPVTDLNRVADQLNSQTGVGQRPAASVDLVRSRVLVSGVAVWCSATPLSRSDAEMVSFDPEPAMHSCPAMP